MTNTNTVEWGNIELPGLSDEKLLKTNWNKVRNSKALAETTEWKTAHKQAVTSSEYRKNKSKTTSEKWQDPTFVENHSKAMKGARSKESYSKNMSAAQQKVNADLDKLKRKQSATKKTVKTKEWKDALAKGQKDFRNDLEKYAAYMEKIMATREQAVKNTRKALMADGVEYAGLSLCARALGIAVGTLQTRMKNHPDKYYYITK